MKKYGGELVIPGNIIIRQRGTKWHPGRNVGMGRDFTIYATVEGHVRFRRSGRRAYISVDAAGAAQATTPDVSAAEPAPLAAE